MPSNAADCNVFLTLGGELIGAVKVADTVRDESAEVISHLKSLGAQNTVMLTGDSESAAKSVAAEVGVDSCRARLLPADKLSAVEAADAVLSSGTLHALPKAVKTARRTMRTIRTNIIFALAVKAAVIVLACFGLAAIWMSVVADTGVCVLCVLYTARLLKIRK